MSRNPCICGKNTSVREIAELMRSLDLGLIPVCSANEIYGVVTDRDIVIRAVASGAHPRLITAAHIMTPGAFHCDQEQTVNEALALMEDHQVRRLLVLDDDDRLVGIVSLADIATHCEDELVAAETLREICRPYPMHMTEDEEASEPFAASVAFRNLVCQRRESLDPRD